MNTKKVNWLFLWIVIAHFGVVGMLLLLPQPRELPILFNLSIGQLIIIVPTLLFVFGKKIKLNTLMSFKKIRFSTILLIVVFTYLIMPLTSLLNAISMLFSDNIVQQISGDIVELPFILSWLFVGVIGPFCEEFVFRGVVFGGYQKDISTKKAIFVSAILFGLMHLNFNQAPYAIVIGIVLVLLRIVTKSMWGPLIFHIIFNSHSIILLYFVSKSSLFENIENTTVTVDTLIPTICILAVVSLVTTALAIGLLLFIKRREESEAGEGTGKEVGKKAEDLVSEPTRAKILTIPLCVAIGICLLFMVYTLF